MKTLSQALQEMWAVSAKRNRESAAWWRQQAAECSDPQLFRYATAQADRAATWADEDEAKAVSYQQEAA